MLRRFAEKLAECYVWVAVCGFPWFFAGSRILAVLLLLPLLVWMWRDAMRGEPDIRC